MEVDTRKKRNSVWLIWWNHFIHLWYIPTLQPSNFGRVYAAPGRIFVISAVI